MLLESFLPAGTIPVRSTAGQQTRIARSNVWLPDLSHALREKNPVTIQVVFLTEG